MLVIIVSEVQVEKGSSIKCKFKYSRFYLNKLNIWLSYPYLYTSQEQYFLSWVSKQ